VRPIALILMGLLLMACSSPVHVTRMHASEVDRRLTRSALSTGKVSIFTQNVLLETNLADLMEDDPEKALEKLHDIAVSGSGGPRQLFAVAEASFLHAERTGKRAYHLATALYAWAYLFPEDPSETPSPFDPRFQLAANLYNRGLTSALVSAQDGTIVLRSGTLELPRPSPSSRCSACKRTTAIQASARPWQPSSSRSSAIGSRAICSVPS
jgi:hypothetical protein